MKKVALLISLAFALFLPMAFAAQTVINITAHVYKALTVNQVQPMEFGNLYVTTGTTTTKQATGSFEITGEANATVSIDYPNSVSLNGPSNNSLQITIVSNDENVALSSNGRLTKSIVGEATVNANTAAGDYSGTATVTVAYV